jgi:hypothetical protein
MRADYSDRELALSPGWPVHDKPYPHAANATAVPDQIPPFCLKPKATLRPIYGRLPAI